MPPTTSPRAPRRYLWLLRDFARSELATRSWQPGASHVHLGPLCTRPLGGSPATWNSAVQCPLPPRTSGQPPKLQGRPGSLSGAPGARLPLALAPASPGVPPELHSAARTRAQGPARPRITPASRFPTLEGVSSRLHSAGLRVLPQGPQDPPSFGASSPGVIQKLVEYKRQQALYQAGNQPRRGLGRFRLAVVVMEKEPPSGANEEGPSVWRASFSRFPSCTCAVPSCPCFSKCQLLHRFRRLRVEKTTGHPLPGPATYPQCHYGAASYRWR